jgi:hypothetical protein
LPTIDEFSAIHDPTQWVGCGNRINWEIDISGSMNWSSSPGKASDEAWIFNFLIGKKESRPFILIQKEDFAFAVCECAAHERAAGDRATQCKLHS